MTQSGHSSFLTNPRNNPHWRLVRIVLIVAALSINSCAAHGTWGSNSIVVKSVKLHTDLPSGSYDVYECSLGESDGLLRVIIEGEIREIGYCAAQSRTDNNGRLHISEDSKRLCLWRETGSCTEDGLCESWFFADNCFGIES